MVVVVAGAGAGGDAGAGAVVEVVVVVGGTVVEVEVVVATCGRLDARWNAAATDVDGRDRCPAAWPELAVWTATTAQTATSRIGTSPMARPCRARGERMGECSWVGND